MLKFLLGLVLGIFLFLVIGSILLEEFPAVQPLWEEVKLQVVTLYNMSIVRYGAIPTLLIIAGLFILIGSSKRM
ncbi:MULTISPECIES: hypothetical protein [Oceanobacillus]|uniref:hypothetical protein n=1 Tax=Oceanobacillus TaxID=182709 RepID=UPI000595C5EE|nr:hypothetical protein [Oceanobacillus jeddahense]